VTYMQFMEDTFGTAATFEKAGVKEYEVNEEREFEIGVDWPFRSLLVSTPRMDTLSDWTLRRDLRKPHRPYGIISIVSPHQITPRIQYSTLSLRIQIVWQRVLKFWPAIDNHKVFNYSIIQLA
jgi:hypothetical protein